MTEQEVKELLIKTNAIMEGHFLLTSGLHSPMYVEKFNVLQQPKYTEQLCKALAEYFADKNIDIFFISSFIITSDPTSILVPLIFALISLPTIALSIFMIKSSLS